MNHLKPILISFCFLFCVSFVQGQDAHFSQYNASPLYLNPGMTGVFGGNYRATAIYRSQWNSVLEGEAVPLFRTIAASYDMRFNKGIGKYDAFGVGVMLFHDKAGESKFSTNQVNFSFAYMKALNRHANNFISFGIQAGAANRNMKGDLRFGNQFDGEGFNPALPSNEVSDFGNFTFFDINMGAFWYYAPKKRVNYFAGLFAYHINRPSQSFFGGNEAKMFMKSGLNAGVQFPIASQVDFIPTILIMKQGPSFQTNLGASIKWLFDSGRPIGNAFYFGPQYRIVRGIDGIVNSEALILVGKMDYENFTFGLSYDLNFSDLTDATNSRGGFEASVIYIGSFRKKNKVFCPRF